jgi:hypothetical protein
MLLPRHVAADVFLRAVEVCKLETGHVVRPVLLKCSLLRGYMAIASEGGTVCTDGV